MTAETKFVSGTHGDVQDLLNNIIRKLPEWLSDGHTYAQDELAAYQGKIYVSLSNGNTDHNPASEPSWWAEYSISNVVKYSEETGAPLVSDNASQGYENGAIWLDTDTDEAYIKAGESGGTAVWIQLGVGSSAVTSMFAGPSLQYTGDVGIGDLIEATNQANDNDQIVFLDLQTLEHFRVSKVNFLSEYVRATRAVSTSEGVTGGGDLSADRALALALDTITAGAGLSGVDLIAYYDDSLGSTRSIAVSTLASFIATQIAASQIASSPVGGVSATDVQAAIQELDSEKAPMDISSLTDGTGLLDSLDLLIAYNIGTGETVYVTVGELLALVGGGGGVDPSRQILTGAGLSGGGDLSADRTLIVDLNSLPATSQIDGTEDLMVSSVGALRKVSVSTVLGNPRTDVRVERATGQVLTGIASSEVRIDYDSEVEDALNEFDGVTNHNFTAQDDGVYDVRFAFSADADIDRGEIVVQGTSARVYGYKANGGTDVHGAAIMAMSQGDTLEIRAVLTGVNPELTGGAERNFLHIRRV